MCLNINKYIEKMKAKREGKGHFSILKLHDEKMVEFSETNKRKVFEVTLNSIKKKNQEIEMLKREAAVKRVNNTRPNYRVDDNHSYKVYQLVEEIAKLKVDYEYLKSGRKEIDYTLSTCQLLQTYMTLDEAEKELMLSECASDVEQQLYEINYKKNDIIDEFMNVIDPEYIPQRNLGTEREFIYCEDCHIKFNIKDGMAVCCNCGKCIHAIHQAEDLSYKEQQEMDYRPQFTYQKETHLDDWLRRFQAKEHKEIPEDILDKVILEAHKQRVKDLSTLTEQQVKKFLKKLELNDYYDNVIAIINRINKRPPFYLTNEVEQKIKDMFKQIQAPFEKHKGPDRKNMLSYSYLLHHFFLILDLPEFSKYFFLLKSPEKLRQQDQTFKKIVDELSKTDRKTNWRFHPSL